MNQDNINSSFDALFDQKGWIVTTNEGGKVKAAGSCNDDESNMFEKTRDWLIKSVDETKQDTFKPAKCEMFKTARLFVRDLLNSEHKNGYFVFRNMPYVEVFICGTVVGLYPYKDKYSIVVDDCTSTIKCLIDQNSLDSVRENFMAMKVVELDKSNTKSEDSIFLEAAAVTTRSAKSVKDLVPTFHELSLGNVVKILGNLSEYNSNRYIFIKKIIKEDTNAIYHTKYVEDMINLYTAQYMKK